MTWSSTSYPYLSYSTLCTCSGNGEWVFCCSNSSFCFFRVTLQAWATWLFSSLESLPLCLGLTGGSSPAPWWICRMLDLEEQPGLTISTSILPPGTATSHTWSVHFHPKEFFILLTKVGVVLGYILHHTRGKAVKVDPMVNLVLWQVNNLNQSQSSLRGLLPCCLCCRLWSARLEIWWTDNTFHGNCLQRFAGEPL